MSLADELLADLEDDEEEDMETEDPAELSNSQSTELSEKKEENKDVSNSSVKDVARLYHSNRLKDVLEKIKEFSGKPRKAEELQGPVEADPEYMLIVNANNLMN